MKIHQHGTKIFNKIFSFEVSIGLLPLILIVSSKENPSTWQQDIYQNVQF